MSPFTLFRSAVCAGFAIGLGGAVYLQQTSKALGALLFTIGLAHQRASADADIKDPLKQRHRHNRSCQGDSQRSGYAYRDIQKRQSGRKYWSS